MNSFGTKAETLERLRPRIKSALVLPQVRCTVAEWRAEPEAVCQRVHVSGFGAGRLIVRSSAMGEDGIDASLAGHFLSVPGVQGEAALRAAIDKVVGSYTDGGGAHQVLIQPMLERVAISGVAFSRDPSTGSPYVVVNYDATTGETDTVTGGGGKQLETYYRFKHAPTSACAPHGLDKVIDLLLELERELGTELLDIEFALDAQGELYLLQVRRLTGVAPTDVSDNALARALDLTAARIERLCRRHPYLQGDRTIFGVMPDWNPAEIVGTRPRPLALSLYRELVTDAIWAYQRDNYGYRNLRSFPLIVSFAGLPYVDVRVSFNSFVPKDLPAPLAERLVNYYLDRLRENPANHDKVEFEIIYTCYTLDLADRLQRLRSHGFSAEDCAAVADSLRQLTNRIIHADTGLWRDDIAKIARLEERFDTILATELDPVARIYWLIADCQRYGTLPFAGLARAGFIAVQLLKSLVNVNVLSQRDYDCFMTSLNTVGSMLSEDLAKLSRSAFLKKYGHLRPGTYDILSERYDEAPDRYFDWAAPAAEPAERKSFQLTLAQLRRTRELLRAHGLDHDILELFDFVKGAIEGREYAKFVFTRSLSEVLNLVRDLGAAHGLTADDCSYLSIDAVMALYSNSDDIGGALKRSLQEGRERYAVTRRMILPPLISQGSDVWAFQLPPTAPNFITQGKASGPVTRPHDPPEQLRDSVLMIPSADPGFDWIFSRGIASFITMYGGVNSHMAIRAAELGIPAVIGAGERNFTTWSTARTLEVDCALKQVKILR